MTALERRYRRLLSWYPPEYRLAYEEEMVGVLMAGAQPQQQRPSWRESVNLAWNASLARLGNRRRTVHDGRWYAASAVFGLLGALVLLTDQLRQAIGSHSWSDKYMNLFYYGPALQRWGHRWRLGGDGGLPVVGLAAHGGARGVVRRAVPFRLAVELGVFHLHLEHA